MKHVTFQPGERQTRVVGSFGGASDLLGTPAGTVKEACDIAEIRLDLLEWNRGENYAAEWARLSDIPLLFTARRQEEGGANALSATDRSQLLEGILDHASLIDVEVASIGEMGGILERIKDKGIPWVASWHDFEKLPPTERLEEALERAREAGATVFKAAARIHSPADMARLAEFQLIDHGMPVSTMGMGPLAPVSRLLCAQSGSVLNYGFIGKTATAPGQWDSAFLKAAISKLADRAT